MQVHKTTFISYGRSNYLTARAVYQSLESREFDVFLDHEFTRSASYESIIFDQIATRAHFIVLLTPSMLIRCQNPRDWLRREIEWAIDQQRNIISLHVDGCNMGDFAPFLTGKLRALTRCNALLVEMESFKEAMAKLINEHLSVPVDIIVESDARKSQLIAHAQKARTRRLFPVMPRQLNAEVFFEQGVWHQMKGQIKGAIRDYSRAIQLNPHFAEAYNHRGVMLSRLGYTKRAIADYTQAVHLNPKNGAAYCNRAFELAKYGYYDDALQDYTQALTINPDDVQSYHGRGQVHYKQENFARALEDYSRAIDHDPMLAKAYNDRGVALFKLEQYALSRADFSESIRLNPDDTTVYMNRATVCEKQGDLNGAIADYEKALVLNPEVKSVRQHLKRLYRIRRQLLGRLPQ